MWWMNWKDFAEFCLFFVDYGEFMWGSATADKLKIKPSSDNFKKNYIEDYLDFLGFFAAKIKPVTQTNKWRNMAFFETFIATVQVTIEATKICSSM